MTRLHITLNWTTKQGQEGKFEGNLNNSDELRKLADLMDRLDKLFEDEDLSNKE